MTDFDHKIELTQIRVRNSLQDLKDLERHLKIAETKTEELLEIASSVGVELVSIGKHTELIDSTKNYPYTASGSIFTPIENRHGGWPAAWHIAEKAGVSYGAGNGGQHQAHTVNLIDGVYECRNGQWSRVDSEVDA